MTPRCGCDPSVADHVFVSATTAPDSGDVTETTRCVSCGGQWSDTYQHGEYLRRTDDARLWEPFEEMFV